MKIDQILKKDNNLRSMDNKIINLKPMQKESFTNLNLIELKQRPKVDENSKFVVTNTLSPTLKTHKKHKHG